MLLLPVTYAAIDQLALVCTTNNNLLHAVPYCLFLSLPTSSVGYKDFKITALTVLALQVNSGQSSEPSKGNYEYAITTAIFTAVVRE